MATLDQRPRATADLASHTQVRENSNTQSQQTAPPVPPQNEEDDTWELDTLDGLEDVVLEEERGSGSMPAVPSQPAAPPENPITNVEELPINFNARNFDILIKLYLIGLLLLMAFVITVGVVTVNSS
jgi:hypothetical protein